jgi:hypothetical protein
MNTNCCIATSLIVQNIVPLNDNYFVNNIVNVVMSVDSSLSNDNHTRSLQHELIEFYIAYRHSHLSTFHCSTKLWLTSPVLTDGHSLYAFPLKHEFIEIPSPFQQLQPLYNRISGVMVSVLASSVW